MRRVPAIRSATAAPMKFVGWVRHGHTPWFDMVRTHQEWVAWRAMEMFFRDYSDREEMEFVVLPDGEVPDDRDD